MASTLQQPSSSGTNNYLFGTADANVVSVSVEKSFGTNIEAVDGTGVLKDILVGAEQHKFTVTKYLTGTTVPAQGDAVSGGGVSGIAQKVSTVTSNEDFTKVTYEGIHFPAITGTTTTTTN